MIENDCLKSTLWGFPGGNCKQTIDFVAFRDIADEILVIIGGSSKLFLENDLATSDLQVSQVLDGDLSADFEDVFRFRRCR